MDAAKDDARLAEWVQRIAAGDVQAFASFYEDTATRVLGRVRRLTGKLRAEDALVKIYQDVWANAGSFDARTGDAMAWLTAIARAHALDRVAQEMMCGSPSPSQNAQDAAGTVEAGTRDDG